MEHFIIAQTNGGIGAFSGAGILFVLLFSAALVFLIVLFVAPIKLYSIHREIRYTNDLLKQQTDLLAKIEDRSRAQVEMLATVANIIVKKAKEGENVTARPAATLPPVER